MPNKSINISIYSNQVKSYSMIIIFKLIRFQTAHLFSIHFENILRLLEYIFFAQI